VICCHNCKSWEKKKEKNKFLIKKQVFNFKIVYGKIGYTGYTGDKVNMTIETITDIDRFRWILKSCILGEKIIDIGSQDGHTFNGTPFAQFVTSIDLDKYDFPGFIQMDAASLQFPDKTFDIAVLGEILEHVDDPVLIMKEAARVAKRVLITVPNEYEWDKSLLPFKNLEEYGKSKNQTREDMAKEDNPKAIEFHTEDNYKHLFHNRYYTQDLLKKDLELAGIVDYKMEKLQYGQPQWSFFVVDTNINTVNISTENEIVPSIIYGTDINVADILSNKGKLRIALVSTPFFGVPPKKYGGLEQIVWDLAEGLDELGHIVTLFAPEGSKVPKHGVLVTTGPAIDTVNVDWFREEENRYFKWKEIITNDRYDIIHDHSWFGFPYFQKMNNLKLRVIHTHHGGYIWATAPPFPKPNLVSISKFMKQYTEQYFKQKGFNIQSEYVYNGIDLDRYNINSLIEKKTNNLLYVGRFSAFKDPLMAMRIALKTGFHIDLIGGSFVEDPNYIVQLEKMCEGKDMSIYKDVSHEFKIEKMQLAKAIIVPSKMNEPFGLICIEAMACGTAVICSRDGALPEIVIDGVTGFICDTEEQMIEAVSKVDSIKSSDCRKRAEKFSKSIMAENYVKLYEKMMKGEYW
jgi:glycosyltransferase involved in cell wall biosynthesis